MLTLDLNDNTYLKYSIYLLSKLVEHFLLMSNDRERKESKSRPLS